MTIEKNWIVGSQHQIEVQNHTFFEYIKNHAYLVELNLKQKEGRRSRESCLKPNQNFEIVFNLN